MLSCFVLLASHKKPLDVVAIDHFPSLLPRESSTRFADDSTPHLLKLTQVCFDYVKIHQKFLLISRL